VTAPPLAPPLSIDRDPPPPHPLTPTHPHTYTPPSTHSNSTLDPVLRREVSGPDWRALAAFAALASAYLFSPPGVLPGAYDYYVRTPLYRRGSLGQSSGNSNNSTSLRALDRDDIVLGRRLGSGGFGDVYRATLADGVPGFGAARRGGDEDDEEEEDRAVVVKRAKEFGEAEAWMNERMARAAPEAVAGFVAAFEERAAVTATGSDANRRRRVRRKGATGAGGLFGLLGAGGGGDEDAQRRKRKKEEKRKKREAAAAAAAAVAPPAAIWLVWRDEGDRTLADLMAQREWPYSAEQVLLGRELRLPKGARRRAVTVRLAARQLLECIAACHSAGIVHRDIKPQNAIVATRGGGRAVPVGGGGGEGEDEDDDASTTTTPTQVGRLKLIDLGAAADLRIGINYAPSEYLMDPRYAPPQQYIMQRQTPPPPPAKPVAALLSPVLWAVGKPDRFDVYSAGVTIMQMVFPPLRTDSGLFQFRKKLEEAGWDLREWRRKVEAAGAGGGGGSGTQRLLRGEAAGGARALFGALSRPFGGGAGGASSSSAASASSSSTSYAAGFELLDLDGGAGWELVCGLLALQPGDRLSAAAALRHPWLARAEGAEGLLSSSAVAGVFSPVTSSAAAQALSAASAAAQAALEGGNGGNGANGATTAVAAAARQLGRVAEAAGGSALIESALTHGAGRDGALTEAQLADEFGYADVASLAALEAAAAAEQKQQKQLQAARANRRKNKAVVAKKAASGGGLRGLFGRGRAELSYDEESDDDDEDEEQEQQQQQAKKSGLPRLSPPAFLGGGGGGGGPGGGSPRNARRTIAWWQERESDLQRQLAARRQGGASPGVSRTIRGGIGSGSKAPPVVVAVPSKPAMFEKKRRKEEEAVEEQPTRVAPERPGSPAAIAWFSALLPPSSQPSTVAGAGAAEAEEEGEDGNDDGDDDDGVVAAAAAGGRERRRR